MKIPYGISNFKSLSLGNYYYVDKTKYIEVLENYGENYIFFLRPRRFGKSLFVSMLNYYYGIEYKDEFKDLFGKYYIGKNPTEKVNSYYILKFEFSRIETKDTQTTYRDFIKFNEKYIKVLFVAFANLSNLYYIKSEQEIEQKYPDVMFLNRPPFKQNYQFIFELKYLKKKEANQLSRKKEEAKKQLQNYLKNEEIQNLKNLKAYIIIFVGDEAKISEEI